MYFDGITVGQKVYDRDGKEWEVAQTDYDSEFPVRIYLGEIWWDSNLEGYARGFESLGQQFFWAPPQQIEVPPRPKRMVKKKVEGWINLYVHTLHDMREDAIDNRALEYLGDPIFIRHEYEEEE